MSADEHGDEALRSAYRALAEESHDDGRIDADRIWEAVGGSSPASERRKAVEHMAGHPGSALLWRLARELRNAWQEPIDGPEPARPTAAKRIVRYGAILAAAAAVVAIAIGTWAVRPGPAEPPQYRTPELDRVGSDVAPDGPLDRGRFLLRWSPVADGARYDVRVMTESLVEIASARDLDRPELLVPPSALGALPSGSRILWQVTARLPSGAEVTSETFVSVIE